MRTAPQRISKKTLPAKQNMNQKQKFILSIICTTSMMLSGCATSAANFYQNPSGVGDLSLCSTWESAKKNNDQKLSRDTLKEIKRRGMNEDSCTARTTAVKAIVIAGVVVLAVAVAKKASKKGGGGGGGEKTSGRWQPTGTTDRSYAWDYFIRYGSGVWVCRGKQTGQFAELVNCDGLPQHDYTWPGNYYYFQQ